MLGRDELYKTRSSRKIDSQLEKRTLGSPILLKIVSENRFSGKTYFYTIASSLMLDLTFHGDFNIPGMNVTADGGDGFVDEEAVDGNVTNRYRTLQCLCLLRFIPNTNRLDTAQVLVTTFSYYNFLWPNTGLTQYVVKQDLIRNCKILHFFWNKIR